MNVGDIYRHREYKQNKYIVISFTKHHVTFKYLNYNEVHTFPHKDFHINVERLEKDNSRLVKLLYGY